MTKIIGTLFGLLNIIFNHEGMESSPNPLMICTDIAARTKQIRLGQACNVITFWNPIRLAEDIAALDHLF